MHYLIIGFGVTGQSILKYLVNVFKSSGLVITIYDQNPVDQNIIEKITGQKISLGNITTIGDITLLEQNSRYQNVDLAIASPGVKPSKYYHLVSNKYNIKIISDIQLFINKYLFSEQQNNQRNNNQIYSITGTNGKSTASALLDFILGQESCLAGNFGLPVTELLTTNDLKPRTVLELSSYQLALTDNLPSLAATCLNISPDHLDWHNGYENYCSAKMKIYDDSEYDILDLNEHSILDLYCARVLVNKLKKKQRLKFIFYRNFLDSNCPDHDSELVIDTFLRKIQNVEYTNVGLVHINMNQNTHDLMISFNQQSVISVNRLPVVLQTKHNLNNLLAVLSLVVSNYLLSHSPSKDEHIAEYLKQCLENINQFKGLPYRCELVSNFNNIKVYNDSKATNLNATITAMRSLISLNQNNPNCKILLILGGIVKEDIEQKDSRQEFSDCLLSSDKITDVIIFTKDNNSQFKFIDLIKSINALELEQQRIKYYLVDSLDTLKAKSFQLANPGDSILFSPAGASFDAFQNYIDRGEQFTHKFN